MKPDGSYHVCKNFSLSCMYPVAKVSSKSM